MGSDAMKASDISRIRVCSLDAFSSTACSGRGDVEIDEGEDPHFEELVLERVRAKGNLVTFRVKVVRETGD